MTKTKKTKKHKVAVTILRENAVYEGDPVTLLWQKQSLERYCRDKKIKVEDYHYADESYVHWGDFRTFLACLKNESFKPDLLLFTSWEIFAPLLDRFPLTLDILASKGIKIKSIKKDNLKHALNK